MIRLGPIGWGLLGGAAAAAALLPATGGALDRLAAARHARAAAGTPPLAPVALVRPDLAWAAGPGEGADMLAAELRARARAGGVLVERAEALAAPEGLATLAVRLSGSERAVLALADGFERGTPLARWRSWRLAAAGQGVRLDGELVAPWR